MYVLYFAYCIMHAQYFVIQIEEFICIYSSYYNLY